jgi:hypothetical protein
MKKILFLLAFFLFFLVAVEAQQQTLGFFKEGECIDLVQNCANCTYVNISRVSLVSTFNTSIILDSDVSMTKRNTVYNYTFCDTNTSGEYIVDWNADPNGITTIGNYNLFVSSSGIPHSESRTNALTRSIYFFMIFSIITFIGGFVFKKPAIKTTFFLSSALLILTTINLVHVTLVDELINPSIVGFFDNFTAISFILVRFIFTIIIVLWIVVLFATMFDYKKKKKKEREEGEW